jgi:hypothetical protein
VDNNPDWIVALASAVVGGLLTISGDVALRAWGEGRRTEQLIAAVYGEVGIISAEADRRREPAPGGGVALNSPLPTTAWTSLVASGRMGRLAEDERAHLFDLYRTVEQANYLAAQVPLLLATAQSQEADGASWFHQEARRLATTPYPPIVGKATKLLANHEAKG